MSVVRTGRLKRQRSLRSLDDLISAGLTAPAEQAALRPVADIYAIAVTPQMAGLIDSRDPADPIGRQFLPTVAELDRHPDELDDPIGDTAHMPVKGIVHRYPDRVLLKPSHVCPVYCRFCFRREMVGPGGDALTEAELEAAFAYIRAHEEIFEVILTGGDPLMMSARRLAALMTALSAIPHVSVIRLHTRVPVVDPSRVDADMLAALDSDKAVFVVLHVNHARELGDEAAAACRRIGKAGIPMLSQTVLLRGINDAPGVLETLLRRVVALRVKPYYLHHGDMAPGTGQFRTSIEAGQDLVRQLRGHVSGLCQPTYVLDIPGGYGKIPIGPSYLAADAADGARVVTDYQGRAHLYPPS